MEETEEEGLKILEEGLKSEIIDLKNQIEENELVYGIPSKGMSSIYVPRDPDHFRRQRRLILQRTMEVCTERPLKLQSESMKVELETCGQREYTYRSLPLLIHQHFLDTIQETVMAKHLHLLRWKRYCITTAIGESIGYFYKERMQHIMEQYMDASARSHRLAIAQEGILANSDQGIDELSTDDILIYLRWFITHLYSLKLLMQLNRIIQWFPIVHRKDLISALDINIEKISDSTSHHPNSDSQSYSTTTFADSAPMPPPLVASIFVNIRPLNPSEFNLSLAAAGGGMVTDEKHLRLPLHTNEIGYLRPHLIILSNVYGIDMDIIGIKSSADEMELFSLVNRKFKQHFALQEQMRNFHTYECPRDNMAGNTDSESDNFKQQNSNNNSNTNNSRQNKTGGSNDSWGLESSTKALRKPANWLEYVKVEPKPQIHMIKEVARLRKLNQVDELLRAANKFISMVNYERVQDALRHHALLVQHPPVVHSAAVIAHPKGMSVSEIFKKIYTNQELYTKKYTKRKDGTLEDARDSYEFTQSMQMLGLDDSNETRDDPSSVQGAYLSYLHLRHLKIRDLQRTCLSIFNYFRSVQRTLTINDQGLSLDGGIGERSLQNHRTRASVFSQQGGGGNIGSHGHLFNTPREFRINETEFMQFSEVENHDDFYFHEDGRIHVKDQMGYWIVYDIALSDFQQLETDLILIATVFINKDKDLRDKSLFKRKQQNDDTQNDDTDISQLAHQEVDRFGVLYDIWSNHTLFLECKKKLFDVYMEVYQNTFNRDERRLLAQKMTDIMFCYPRIDFEAQYFAAAYRIECAILRLKLEFSRNAMNMQIDRQREYLRNMAGEPLLDFGLPYPVIDKLAIAVNADESALKNVFFLEYHPSLSMLTHLADSVEWCYQESIHLTRPNTVTKYMLLEKRLYEILQLELDHLENLGVSYSPQAQKDLFSGYFVENPILMTQLAEEHLVASEARNARGDKRSRKIRVIDDLGKLLDVVGTRFRLIDAAWESEVLAKCYRHQANDLGYDEYHLHMRPLQFEAAKRRDGAEHARPPLYISSVQDDDTAIDKYTPSALMLAINEIDEVGAGKFSFKGRTNIIEMLEGRGVECLITALKVQLCHKNSLAAAVTLCNACRPSIFKSIAHLHQQQIDEVISSEETRTRSERSTTTGNPSLFNAPLSSQAGPTPLALDDKRAEDFHQKDAHPEGFFSVQLEKTPCRDRTMNLFIKKFAGKSPSGNEAEKVKLDLINVYVADVFERIQQASLRAQIINFFNSIIDLLLNVPSVAKKYFQFGESFEKKTVEDNMSNQETDPRKLRRRARRIISEDGSKLLNLWYIPHFTDILFLFKQHDTITGKDNEEEQQRTTQALLNLARLVGTMHDILQFVVGWARLGVTYASMHTELRAHNKLLQQDAASTIIDVGSESFGNVNSNHDGVKLASLSVDEKAVRDYDGGIMSELSTDLIEIEQQIMNLEDPTDINQVIEMLSLRRDITFMKFQYVIGHVLPETLLSTENEEAYYAISKNMKYPLEDLSNIDLPQVLSLKLQIPEPFEARDKIAQEIFPWRALINRFGPFLIMDDLCRDIQSNLQLCLAALSQVDRPIVHGEFLSLNLCLEDVLNVGDIYEAKAGEILPITEYDSVILLGKKFQRRDKKEVDRNPSPVNVSTNNSEPQPLNLITNPVKSYKLIKKFLIISKRLDILKYHWGARKLGLERIDTCKDFKFFCKLYKTEKLYPLLKSLFIQYRLPDLAQQGPFSETDIFVCPKGLPDIVVKQRQLSKMLETIESSMIGELRKRIVRQTDQVIKERNREEGNLPLDLWKKPAMKEAISVKRPSIAEDFIESLMGMYDQEDEEFKNAQHFSFSKEHLNQCLQDLTIAVFQMQRESYENYAMYYENQLKHQHQLLYSREREVEDMRQKLIQRDIATNVNVQFQLADQAHSLLLEVNALRAKVSEMRDEGLVQEQKIRQEVRQEYNTMVQNLFSVAFEQKSQIDVYREYLHEATLKRIQEVRTEAALEMSKVKEKSGAKVSADDELADRNLKLAHEVTELQRQNIHVRQMMGRMKSLFTWHHTFLKCNYQKIMNSLELERDGYKNSVTSVKMHSEQRVQLMNEELDRLKESLTGAEKELNDLRRTLDREMKEKLDKKHAAERKAATDRQMALVKQMHIDQLMLEIGEKNCNLTNLSEALTVTTKSHKSVTDSAAREVDGLRKALREERRLKRSAFTKVDDLVSQVYEFEAAFSLTKAGNMTSPSPGDRDSISCSMVSRPLTASVGGSTGSKLVPLTDAVPHRAATRPRPVTYGDILRRYPMPYTPEHLQNYRKDRVGAQSLRRRIADQLLLNKEPETHEQLTKSSDIL